MSVWLGCDPGPSLSALALVEAGVPRARPRVLCIGTVPTTGLLDAVARVRRDRRMTGHLASVDATKPIDLDVVADGLAVEVPGHMHPGGSHGAAVGRANALLRTLAVAKDLAGRARADSWPVQEITAHMWRLGVVGNGQPSDAQIKRALLMQFGWLPNCSCHVRDAIGVALAAARAARQLPLFAEELR